MIFLFLLGAYLIGSFSPAIFLSKVLALPDPRTQGSKNPGATNIWRTQGFKLAFLVFTIDVLKGFIPVMVGLYFGFPSFYISLIALATFLGHLYPIFFRFQGGKGVATALGCIMALSWMLGCAALLTWVIIFSLFRYVSLASLVAAALLPVYAFLLQKHAYLYAILAMTFLIFWRHRSNIYRLYKGTE